MRTNKHEFDFSSSASVALDAVLVGGGGAYPDEEEEEEEEEEIGEVGEKGGSGVEQSAYDTVSG